jgi:hypothetical protein
LHLASLEFTKKVAYLFIYEFTLGAYPIRTVYSTVQAFSVLYLTNCFGLSMLISRRPKINENCKEQFSVLFFYCNSNKGIETVKATLKVKTLKLDFLRRNGSEKLIFDFQSLG